MKYLVGLLLGGLMEDPEPRFGNPYLIVEAPDEKTARKLYNEATNAYYFYGDVMGQETDNGWTATSPQQGNLTLIEYFLRSDLQRMRKHLKSQSNKHLITLILAGRKSAKFVLYGF